MNLKLTVAILAIAVVPVCAQAQQSSTAKLKADAQNVVKIITGDKAKTQTYCQIADLIDQREETAEQEKANELSQKITVLVASLPEYADWEKAMSDEDLKAELERLRQENTALKKGAASDIRMKVSEKGAVSIYGMGRFPVTLYKEQWLKLLEKSDDIRAFITANEAQLKTIHQK